MVVAEWRSSPWKQVSDGCLSGDQILRTDFLQTRIDLNEATKSIWKNIICAINIVWS